MMINKNIQHFSSTLTDLVLILTQSALKMYDQLHNENTTIW